MSPSHRAQTRLVPLSSLENLDKVVYQTKRTCKYLIKLRSTGRPRNFFLSENAQNCPKLPSIAQNCPKCPEFPKIPSFAQNYPKWPELPRLVFWYAQLKNSERIFFLGRPVVSLWLADVGRIVEMVTFLCVFWRLASHLQRSAWSCTVFGCMRGRPLSLLGSVPSSPFLLVHCWILLWHPFLLFPSLPGSPLLYV